MHPDNPETAMERFIVVHCLVFLFVCLCLDVILAVPYSYDSPTDLNKRKEDNKATYMWFGPRLGRRKRNPDEEGYRNVDPDVEQMATLLEILEDSPWAIVAIKSDLYEKRDTRKRYFPIIPRLGRQSGLESIENYQRSRYPPRSGRKMTQFTPRLGRELEKFPSV